MSQTDPILGQKVHNQLVKLGIETPMTPNGLSDGEKMDIIQPLIAKMLETLGLDLTDDSLAETPKRVAKLYTKEFFSGMKYDNFPKCTTVENKMSTKGEFVCVRGIDVVSLCEHHLFPIFSDVNKGQHVVVAYIPKKRVLGLSKFSRVVDFFAKRPQIQERLTQQIMEAFKVILESEDVAVWMEAEHTCMSLRGVKSENASTVTLAMSGKFFEDDNIRSEFLAICRK